MTMYCELHSQKPNKKISMIYGTQYPLNDQSYLEFCLAIADHETPSPFDLHCFCDEEEKILIDARLTKTFNEPKINKGGIRKEVSCSPKILVKQPARQLKETPRGEKPQESYAFMIYKALETSPTGKLTLSEIYAWIERHYPYYRSADPVWKNSIRHNLSLNSSFRKIPRPESSKGKGGFWAIDYSSYKNKKTAQSRSPSRIHTSLPGKTTIRGQVHGELML